MPEASDYIPISDSAAVGPLRHSASDHVRVSDSATVRLVTAGPVTISAAVEVTASARIIVGTQPPTVTVTNGHLDLEFQRDQWDFYTFVGGVSLGGLVGRLPGALIGGCVCLAWGRWRWNRAVRR